MKMKRKIAIILMASMVMSFSACNQQKESKPEESKATQITVSSEQAQDSENSYNVDDASKKAETDTKASQKDALSLWNESAPLKTQLTDYIKTITDQSSESYIPVENRIAVFDMDGTLCCETDPGYFDHKLLYYRVMEDPDYKDKASDEEKETAKIIEEYFKTGSYPKGLDIKHGTAVATAFKGMTPDEFDEYVKAYRDQPMNSYTNMTNGQAFYKPMLEVVDYLIANDFSVYIVSGTERNIVRVLLENVLDVPSDRIIGSDGVIKASGQGSKDGLDYVYQPDDKLIYTGELITKNVKMNKVPIIAREIGKVPVLSFGNSSGDLSMSQYITNNKKYESRAYILLGDDSQREHRSEAKVEKLKKYCDEHGFYTISMKNDFATVYGDNVTLQK